MNVKLHFFPRISCQVEDSGVHANGIFRADLDTVSAIDAHAQINVEADGEFLDVRIGMFLWHNRNALGWTDCLAEHATYAAGRAVLAHRQPMATTMPRHQWPKFFGVLDCGRCTNVLEATYAVRNVQKEIAKKVSEGNLQTT